MTSETERRRPVRRTGVEVTEEVAARIAQPGDLDELVAELVAGQDPGYWRVFTAGYGSGFRDGHRAGYVEGLALLDEAGALLGQLRPGDGLEAAAARRRRTEYARKPETAAAIAARARSSWGRVEREIAERVGRQAG